MRLYYFIHLTGRDTGSTGIQRVVRSLGRALQERVDVELIPVRWCSRRRAVVYAEEDFFECMAMFGGPRFTPNASPGTPIEVNHDVDGNEVSWLLIPEVPHLKSHDSRYPSTSLQSLLGYSKALKLRTAVIFHDLLPLTQPAVSDAQELERLAFVVYGQSLINADLVIPNSCGSAKELIEWYKRVGFGPDLLPTIKPVELAHEIPGIDRRQAKLRQETVPIKLVMVGTVCRRKNQLKAFEAFNRLRLRHPKKNLELHVVGTVDPSLVGMVGRQVARSEGAIKIHGFQTDERLQRLLGEAHATVFVSLAEGFGLPVAESLWLGKPCLASNLGSIAEVASSGGCLLVDPSNLGEIERGLEELVSNRAVYNSLVVKLNLRELRTWNEYGSDICDLLYNRAADAAQVLDKIALRWAETIPVAPILKRLFARLGPEDLLDLRNTLNELAIPCPSEPELSSPDETRAHLDESAVSRTIAQVSAQIDAGELSALTVGSGQRSFSINPGDMKFHDVYMRRGRCPIFNGGLIRYRRSDFNRIFRKIEQPHLFYGPYISMAPGRYLFSIDGEIRGAVIIKFFKEMGREEIRRVKATKLSDTIVLDLPDGAENFEIVAERLDETELLEIRGIFVEYMCPEVAFH